MDDLLDVLWSLIEAEHRFNVSVLLLTEALAKGHQCISVPCPMEWERDQTRDALREARGMRPLSH